MNQFQAKLAVFLSFSIGVLLVFFASPHLLNMYVSEAPRAAYVATGHVYEFNQHGTVVYLSLKQLIAVHGLTGIGMLSLITCAVCMKKMVLLIRESRP